MVILIRYVGFMNIIISIYREEGLYVYYRGFLFIIMGIMFYVGISFFIYELFKKFYFDVFYENKFNFLYRFLFGVCAGFFG